MRTTITVSALETYAYHGFIDEEQKLGQKFRFDVHAELTPTDTHCDDDLVHTIGYDRLIEEVLTAGQKARFRTLEALGEHIARHLLGRFEAIARVSVGVAKTSPPIAHSIGRVGVEIALARNELART